MWAEVKVQIEDDKDRTPISVVKPFFNIDLKEI